MRPSAQPFLWKGVLFAWEWKIISISKAEHLASFDREAQENSEMAYFNPLQLPVIVLLTWTAHKNIPCVTALIQASSIHKTFQ